MTNEQENSARCIRRDKRTLYLSLGGMLAFPTLLLAFPPPEEYLKLVYLLIGAIEFLCVGALIDYFVSQIDINEERVFVQNILGKRKISLKDIAEVRWKSIGLAFATIRLIGKNAKVKIEFDGLAQDDVLWLIRFCRRLKPDSEQCGWETFCRDYALPIRDGFDSLPRNPPRQTQRLIIPFDEKVLYTRQKNDQIFVLLLIISCIDAWCGWLWAHTLVWGTIPLTILVLWAFFRWTTPKEGVLQLPILSPRNYCLIGLLSPLCSVGVFMPPFLVLSDFQGWSEETGKLLAFSLAGLLSIVFFVLSAIHPKSRQHLKEFNSRQHFDFEDWRKEQVSKACILWDQGEAPGNPSP